MISNKNPNLGFKIKILLLSGRLFWFLLAIWSGLVFWLFFTISDKANISEYILIFLFIPILSFPSVMTHLFELEKELFEDNRNFIMKIDSMIRKIENNQSIEGDKNDIIFLKERIPNYSPKIISGFLSHIFIGIIAGGMFGSITYAISYFIVNFIKDKFL